MLIYDQRHLYPGVETPEDARAYCEAFLAAHGTAARAIVPDGRTVSARVDAGRWIADCPHCNDGIACWDGNPEGCCLGCGHLYAVRFPPPKIRAEGVAALLERPPGARFWRPDKETPARLRAENTLLAGVPLGVR